MFEEKKSNQTAKTILSGRVVLSYERNYSEKVVVLGPLGTEVVLRVNKFILLVAQRTASLTVGQRKLS